MGRWALCIALLSLSALQLQDSSMCLLNMLSFAVESGENEELKIQIWASSKDDKKATTTHFSVITVLENKHK